jgi:transposase
MEKMLNCVAQTAGVDISKDHLDVCLYPNAAAKRFANDARGFVDLIGWLLPHAPTCVVFEATGAYHRAFERRLGEQGFPMLKVNPCQARRFAEATGKRAKTDQVDAAMLARFGAVLEPPLRPVTAAIFDQMKELRGARQALIKDRVAAQNRGKNHLIALLKRQNTQRLKQIDAQIEAIDAELARLVKQDTNLQKRFDSLVSIPGIGAVTALTLLIEMPELGTLESRAAASLAGLAPITRESGQWKGKSFITGGRAPIRRALYMPAMVAMRFNPDLKAKYEALINAGKPAKLAITAIMRKLVVLANALLKNGSTWVEKTA